MKRARDDIDEDISSVKSSRISDTPLISSTENIFKEVKIKVIKKNKITELNEVKLMFSIKVCGSNKCSLRHFPTYIELSNSTSINLYKECKSDISLHLKNKPKYMCTLNDKDKLPKILDYFVNEELMSLNMDHIDDNKKVVLSFMLSPYKESIFFDDISPNSDFSMSLTSPITDEIGHSLFLCKYLSYTLCLLCTK